MKEIQVVYNGRQGGTVSYTATAPYRRYRPTSGKPLMMLVTHAAKAVMEPLPYGGPDAFKFDLDGNADHDEAALSAFAQLCPRYREADEGTLAGRVDAMVGEIGFDPFVEKRYTELLAGGVDQVSAFAQAVVDNFDRLKAGNEVEDEGDDVSAETDVATKRAEGTKEEVIPEEVVVDATDGAKKLAAEKGVDLLLVNGTGDNGRIQQKDVEKYVAAQPE